MSVFNSLADDAEVRERRLQSVTSYEGSASSLVQQSKTGHVKCPGRLYTQCSDCAVGCAEPITCHVLDSVVISHAPIGCSLDSIMHFVLGKSVSETRGLQRPHRVHMISTNISEKDTVYGALDKLRTAILEAERRYHPKAIFIHGSCASGIIGEDIESAADEMQAQLGYPVVPIYCEGFKSRIWSYGFDAAFHGLLRKIIKAPRKTQPDLVNIFNFEGSDQFTGLLKKLDLRVNFLIPLASVEQIETLTEAACTTHICETLATYLTASLEELYGVPEVKTTPPFGIDWTDAWLRGIAHYTHREEKAEEVIAAEHVRIAPQLAALREKLQGKSLYVLSGDSFAHNLANVAKDLGVRIAGLNTLHHDMHTDNPAQANSLETLLQGTGDIERVTICNKQPYQLVKLVQRLQPDLMIVRHQNLTTVGTKLGVPTLFEGDANFSTGYDGVLHFGKRLVEALATHRIVDNIAAHARLPYTAWWLNHKDIHIKEDEFDEAAKR